MTFKPGTKVRCIDGSRAELLQVGEVYTVDVQHTGSSLLTLKEFPESGNAFFDHRFKEVETAFRAGDRVKCVHAGGDNALGEDNIYTVHSIEETHVGVFVVLEELHPYRYRADCFELVSVEDDPVALNEVQEEINRQEFQRANDRLQAHMRAKREAEFSEGLRKSFSAGVTSGQAMREREEDAKQQVEERAEKYREAVADFMDEAVQETTDYWREVSETASQEETTGRSRKVLERFEQDGPPVRVMVDTHGAYGDLSDLLVLLGEAGDLDMAHDWVSGLQKQGLADMHMRNEDAAEEAPHPTDLVHELHEAVHGDTWARPQSPKEVWEELLEDIEELREQADGRYREMQEIAKRNEVEAKEYREALRAQYKELREALGYPDTADPYFEDLVDEIRSLREAYNALRESQYDKRAEVTAKEHRELLEKQYEDLKHALGLDPDTQYFYPELIDRVRTLRELQFSKHSGMINDEGIRALARAAERYTSDRETVVKVIAIAFGMDVEEVNEVLGA